MPRLVNHFRLAGGVDYIVEEFGAAAAYSFRLLDSTYTGALCRIRRSSDNAEKDFYPDGSEVLSLSSEDGLGTSLSSWITTDSGYVVKWYDQSGNSRDVSQAAAANQPRIVNAGTLDTDPDNGLVAMSFTQASSQHFSTFAASLTTVQVFSHYIVFNRPTATTYNYTSLGASAASPHFFRWNASDVVQTALSGGVNHFTGQTDTGDFIFISLRDSGDNIKVWLNGTAGTTQTAAITGQTVSRMFTNGAYFTGHAQEVILIHSDVEADREAIETNINNFYSVY